MHSDKAPNSEACADSLAARFLPLVEAYEAALRRGEHPAIEEFLSRCDPADRDEMRRELQRVHDQCFETKACVSSSLSALAAVDDEAQPSIGRFTVESLHARGGLGEVFRAVDTELNREVAFKRMQEQFADDDWLKQKFVTEAEITARLDHPGIVPVYGLVSDEHGRPGYAMRFIRGKSLAEAIADHHASMIDASTRRTELDATAADLEKPPESKAPAAATRSGSGARIHRTRAGQLQFRALLQRLIAVCQAVAYAHSRGVIHRDIKPANIMLGEFGETLLVDWGLAKTVGRQKMEHVGTEIDDTPSMTIRPTLAGTDSAPTLMGKAVGTPCFMAPEQAAGRWDVVATAADIYSLGATLYVLLTGRPPFTGSDEFEIRQQVQRGEFSRPSALNPVVARSLEAICLKAMAMSPSDRYETAQLLAADLERYLADEPVAACRETWRIRVGRWTRRHRTLVATSNVALLLIIAATVSGYLIWQSAEQRRAQQAYEHLTSTRNTALANEKLALAELRAGRFAAAEGILQETLARLRNEPALEDVRGRMEARRSDAHRLVEFHRLADLAERLEYEFDDKSALAASAASLSSLDVFAHEKWWQHLPAADLTAEQQNKLREDVYRQLLFLAAIRFKGGVMSFGTPAMTEHAKAAVEAVAATHRYRPSKSGHIIEYICRSGLREAPPPPPLMDSEPTSAADYYILGFAYQGIASGLLAEPKSRFLLERFGPRIGLDMKDPPGMAQKYLQMAVSLEPHHPWTYIWLGSAYGSAGEFEEEAMAYNTCVVLRPDHPAGYVNRVRQLLYRANRTKDTAVRGELLWRGLPDLDRLMILAPDAPELHVARYELFWMLDRRAEAVAALTEALDLFQPPRLRGGWNAAFMSSVLRENFIEVFLDVPEAERDNAEAWAMLAHGFLLLESYDEATKAAARSMQLAPDQPRAKAVRGWVHLQRKEFGPALAEFAAVLAKSPNNYLAVCGRARAREQAGELEAALAGYANLLGAGVTTWQRQEALQGQARILTQLGKSDEARQALDRANVLALENVVSAKALPQHSGSVTPDDRHPSGFLLDAKYALVFVDRGNTLYQVGKHAQATENWDRALRLSPDAPTVYQARAEFFHRRREYDLAIEDYTAAIRLNPLNAEYYRNRGNAFRQKGDHELALTDLNEAIRIDPNSAEGFNLRGNVHHVSARYDTAIADYTAAIRLEPKHTIAHSNRANSLRLAGDTQRALADLQQAIELNARNHEAFNIRGFIGVHNRQYDKAIADFSEAIRLQPKHAPYYANRGDAYGGRGDIENALADLQHSIQLEPDQGMPRHQLALIQLARGNAKEYRDGCVAALSHSAATQDVEIAAHVAHACTLAPAAVPDPLIPLRLAEQAARARPKNYFYQVIHAAALYRAGQFDAAQAQLDQAKKLHGKGGTAHDTFLLALVYRQKGDNAKANEALAAAKLWLESANTEMPGDPVLKGKPLRFYWYWQLELEQLQQEVESALKIDSPK